MIYQAVYARTTQEMHLIEAGTSALAAWAGGVEAVSARQIEHGVVLAGRRVQATFLALDGHAGVVGDLLATAGQGVEQSGLAAVRVSDQRDAGRR